jgi:hypothetical protein
MIATPGPAMRVVIRPLGANGGLFCSLRNNGGNTNKIAIAIATTKPAATNQNVITCITFHKYRRQSTTMRMMLITADCIKQYL